VGSISDRWEPRHKDALRAWEQGDIERLIGLCSPEINTAVRKVFGKFPQLKDIRGAHEELQTFARKGVEKAAGRYDRSKGPPFQAYVTQDIYWETRRGAEALQEEARQGCAPDEVDHEAVSAEEQTGRRLEVALDSLALDQWRDIIRDLDKENLSTLCLFLDKKKAEPTRGDRNRERKYEAVLANIIERGIVLQLREPGVQLKKISGPLDIDRLRELQKALSWRASIRDHRPGGPGGDSSRREAPNL
jgi:hypothetical protein